MKMENLQEQLMTITARRDEVQDQLEQSQEQSLQHLRSVENLQMVLEQFQRGILLYSSLSNDETTLS